MSAQPRILSVGTATPPERYTQAELLARFPVADARVARLFDTRHIHTRHLFLPEPGPDGQPAETQGQLLDKHKRGALRIGAEAVDRALRGTGVGRRDLDAITVVTTTGFLSPGLSAWLLRDLALRPDCHRTDIVGMGCNAGLNGLRPVVDWCRSNRGRNALLLCVEICSAAYVVDGTMRTAVVNSLFGDGAAAVLLRADDGDAGTFAPQVLGFASHMIPDAIDAMRYDWDDEAGKFSFFLDPDIPYVVGRHAETPVSQLLRRFGLRRRDIRHWLVHSGGKKVIDAVKYNVGLTAHDVRHTTSVLRDFGNVSSASFLFSYVRLLEEGTVRRGDHGVMMTMGPGSQIETALIRW